ncbi:anthrone oxygenase family protein [Flexivirga sp. B27]
MTSRIAVAAGIFGALTSAVTAGVYVDFSARIMPSYGRMANAVGIARMQSSNRSIENGPFMLAFCGAGLAGGYLVYRLLRGDRATADVLLAAGGVAYLAGLLLTMVYNVPLNNRLAAVDPQAASSVDLWRDYLAHWTAANSVRAALSVGAVALLVAGLVAAARVHD